MKRNISLIILLVAAAVSINAQAAPDAPELTRLLNKFLAGAGRNDAAIHDRFWASDLIYTRGVGVRVNKEELMKGVRSAPAPKPGDPVTVYSSEDVQIRQYGNAAVVAFKLVGTTTNADGIKTVSNHLNTGTFVKRKGMWQVVAWQATVVPKPVTEPKNATQPAPEETKSVTTSSAEPPVVIPSPKTKSDGARTYLRGSRGGCYYLNSSGKKIYVDQSKCK